MSTMDDAASTIDSLGFMDPDGAPGAEPLVKSSPVIVAAAAAAAAGVDVASALNREWSWGRLKRSQREAKHTSLKALRRRLLSEHNFWNNMNGYVR